MARSARKLVTAVCDVFLAEKVGLVTDSNDNFKREIQNLPGTDLTIEIWPTHDGVGLQVGGLRLNAPVSYDAELQEFKSDAELRWGDGPNAVAIVITWAFDMIKRVEHDRSSV